LAPKSKAKAKAKGAGKAKSAAAAPKAAAGPVKIAGRFNLITCIVQRGIANKVAKAAMDTGAAGATILPARGMGMGTLLGALGHAIVPQKEVIMIVTSPADTRRVFDAVAKSAEMDKMGMGIAYTIPVGEVAGLFENTPS
jgi:nitrogen regulatory protein P-II 1